MYFKLNPECYFVRGEVCGAIYDLISGKIYALDQEETQIMTHCINHNAVDEGIDFLKEVKKLRLGNFYPTNAYLEKIRIDSPKKEDEGEQVLELRRAFLEINNECNRDCWYCGFYGTKRSLGCLGCNKWNDFGDNLSVKRWKEIIDELWDLDCQVIYLIGGDLTLKLDRTMDILDYVEGKFSNVYMVFHQDSLSENIVGNLKNKANLIIQTTDINKIQSDEFTYLIVIKPGDLKCN